MNGMGMSLGWIAALVASSVSTVGYIHSNFMTVREKDTLENRLVRIEANQYKLMEWVGELHRRSQ